MLEEPPLTACRSIFQSEEQTRMNCRTQRFNVNDQFMVGTFGMKMSMMAWNGCKMEVVPWTDWTHNCSREEQGGWQEQEAVATIVWSIWTRIHKFRRSGNSALARILQHLPCGETCVVHLLQTYSAKLLEDYLFEVVSWVLKKIFQALNNKY